MKGKWYKQWWGITLIVIGIFIIIGMIAPSEHSENKESTTGTTNTNLNNINNTQSNSASTSSPNLVNLNTTSVNSQIEEECEIYPLKYNLVDYNISEDKLNVIFILENTRNYPYLEYFEEDYYADYRQITLTEKDSSGKFEKTIAPNYKLSEYFSSKSSVEPLNPMQKRKLSLIFDITDKNLDVYNLYLKIDKTGEKTCFLKLYPRKTGNVLTPRDYNEMVVSDYLIPINNNVKEKCGSSNFVINKVDLKSKIGSKEADGIFLIFVITQNNYNESDFINSLFDLFKYNISLSDKKGNSYDFLTYGNSIKEYVDYFGDYDNYLNNVFYNSSNLDELRAFNPLIYRFDTKLRYIIIYDVPMNNDYILNIGYFRPCNCGDSLDCYHENCVFDKNSMYQLNSNNYYKCSQMEFNVYTS